MSRAASSCFNTDHGSIFVILQKTTDPAVAEVSVSHRLLNFYFARVVVAVEILTDRRC